MTSIKKIKKCASLIIENEEVKTVFNEVRKNEKVKDAVNRTVNKVSQNETIIGFADQIIKNKSVKENIEKLMKEKGLATKLNKWLNSEIAQDFGIKGEVTDTITFYLNNLNGTKIEERNFKTEFANIKSAYVAGIIIGKVKKSKFKGFLISLKLVFLQIKILLKMILAKCC
jgi:rubrerythrin